MRGITLVIEVDESIWDSNNAYAVTQSSLYTGNRAV